MTKGRMGPSVERGVGLGKKITISIDAATHEALIILGDGNFSKGVREAARRCKTAISNKRKTLIVAPADLDAELDALL